MEELKNFKNIEDLRKYILIGDEIKKICKFNNIDITSNEIDKISLSIIKAQMKIKSKPTKFQRLKFVDQPYFKKELAWLFDDDSGLTLDEFEN